MRKPWGLRRAELRDLDDWYVVNVLLRPGEEQQAKDGAYLPVAMALTAEEQAGRQNLKGANFKEMFIELWRSWGDTAAAAQERWLRWLEDNPGVDRASCGETAAAGEAEGEG